MPRIVAAALGLVLAGGAAAQEMQGAFPHLAAEVDLRMIGIGAYQAPERRARGTDLQLRGEIAAGLHLTENFSLQGLVHIEPVGEVEPNGGLTGFRYQGAYVENLFAEWRPVEGLQLFGGKITAPFGVGHHDFPGILPSVRAHEAYLLSEQLGFGATWTVLSHDVLGEHDLTAAAFTLDRSFLSETAFTRKHRNAPGDFERFYRNLRNQGGAGNTGQLDNFAVALDGDGIAALPGFAYHLGVASRGAGRDGTAREWGVAIGIRQAIAWTEELQTVLFAETVRFRNAGGEPLEEVDGLEEPISERRTFTTLGARTGWGPWRAVVAWQQDERKRSANTEPTERYLELSVGREIGLGFAVDVGWSRTRAGDEEGRARTSQAVLGMLSWRAEF